MAAATTPSVSYARAASSTRSAASAPSNNTPPTSLTLVAALQSLQELTVGQSVYLMDRNYLQNWMQWAWHQVVPAHEQERVQHTLRASALKHGLVPPSETGSYSQPGPIDSTSLAVQGHFLVLSPLVRVASKKAPRPRAERTLSDSGAFSADEDHSERSTRSSISRQQQQRIIECSAVPENFYETLRSVHGVVCEDGRSVSFQRYVQGNSERILLHHQQHYHSTTTTQSRPVEFRRKVILAVPKIKKKEPTSHTSLMDKLMLEEEQLRHPYMVPTVEVHPIKLIYSAVQDDDDTSTISSKTSHVSYGSSTTASTAQGFCLVSRETAAVDALMALVRVAAPNKATQSVRLWSKQVYCVHHYSTITTTDPSDEIPDQRATAGGDDYQLVDLTRLAAEHASVLTVKEWVERHCLVDPYTSSEFEVLVETRRTVNSPWPRQALELATHVSVGDFIDAQDVAGKWYEAVVREVDPETVTVHYCGWASRWDTKIRRRRPEENSESKSSKEVMPPAPLWSQTGRWRERLRVGDVVEIRDSSSTVQRPKWFKGEVKKIGKPSDPVRKLTGGADLEEYPVEGHETRKEKLLILKRSQQMLVEVEQERTEKAGVPHSPTGEDDFSKAQPPYLRWVDLYGEEICRINTHLKASDMSRPVTLRYEYEDHRKPVEIMKSFHTPGFMRESLRGTPPAPGSVGLQNLGNSCFLNSTVQCLNHIEPLTQYFLQDKYSAELNRNNPLGSSGNVALAYASLLKKMWGGDYSILAPRLLKQTVASFAPQFDNSYQHDSQEFCQFLMDGLHEDLNRVKTKPYVEELEGFGLEDEYTAIESWRKHLLRHDSIIVDHCQGMHRSHLTCPHCGRESIKFDVYSSISLPLVTFKDQHTVHIQDCLEKFMEGEQLDERNAWYCPNCRKHVCALKMIALWSVPDILILHLKRFTFDTCMISGGMLRSKIDSKVEFPIEGLDLTKHVLGPIDPAAPPIYKLFGVSEHTGPTANSGHYTATVRNSIDGQWYRCNDSNVGLTSGEASVTGGAYVLFFQRSKGLCKWGGMAKKMEEYGIDPYGGLETDQEGFTMVRKKKAKGRKF